MKSLHICAFSFSADACPCVGRHSASATSWLHLHWQWGVCKHKLTLITTTQSCGTQRPSPPPTSTMRTAPQCLGCPSPCWPAHSVVGDGKALCLRQLIEWSAQSAAGLPCVPEQLQRSTANGDHLPRLGRHLKLRALPCAPAGKHGLHRCAAFQTTHAVCHPGPPGCHAVCMTALLPVLAAFVADVFSTAYTQGPSLPYSTRSALMGMFKNDTAMWRTRLQAALQIVRPSPSCTNAETNQEQAGSETGVAAGHCGSTEGMPDQDSFMGFCCPGADAAHGAGGQAVRHWLLLRRRWRVGALPQLARHARTPGWAFSRPALACYPATPS